MQLHCVSRWNVYILQPILHSDISQHTSVFVLWIHQLQAGELPIISCLRLQLLSICSSWNPQKCPGKAGKDWHNRKRFKSHHKMKIENMPVLCNITFICLFTCTFKVHWNCSWHTMANRKQNTRFKLNIVFSMMWASGCQLLFFQLYNWTVFFFFRWCTTVSSACMTFWI